MQIVCLDLEGVLVPEIWIEFANRTGIEALRRTTRDEPDYDKLMKYRLDILREALPAMIRWNDFVWSISNGPIVRPPRLWAARGFTFGDWLQPKGPSEKPLPTIGDDAAATIYLFIAADLTAKIAGLVGVWVQQSVNHGRAAVHMAAGRREV